MVLKDWKKDNINLIIVGETGTGKTTFMSYIDNMCRGRKLEEFENTFDTKIETGGGGNVSQTNEAKLYTIKCVEGQTPRDPLLPAKTINILDTPGLGDTRGIQHDKAHKEKVATEIKNKLGTIDAVVILVNGSQKRWGITTTYALENIAAMFPRSLIRNIAFVLTNCTKATVNFDITEFKDYSQSPHWPIQNPLALWSIYQSAKSSAAASEAVGTTPRYNEDDVEEMKENTEKAYKNGVKFLDEFIRWLDECPVRATKEIDELNKKLNNLDTEVSNVISRLKAMQEAEVQIRKKQEEIAEAGNVSKAAYDTLSLLINTHLQEIDLNKVWEETDWVNVWVRVDTPEHNTMCVGITGTEACHINCHPKCSVEFLTNPEALANQCACFLDQPGAPRDRKCKDCGHPASEHRHDRNRWEQKREAIVKTSVKAKQAFDAATSRKTQIEGLKKKLEDQLLGLKEEIQKKQNEIGVLCNQYKGMSISRGFAWYIYSMKRMLLQRFDARSKEGAPQKELDELDELIKQVQQKYEIAEKEDKSGKSNNFLRSLSHSL